MKATGKILSATLNKSLYEPGDDIWVTVKAHVDYYPEGDWSGWWNTYYRVLNQAGKEVGTGLANHTVLPWTSHDIADETIDIKCGRAVTSEALTVQLLFQSIGLPVVAQYAPLAEVKVNVWVRERETPTPPPSPTPIIPSPTQPPSAGPTPSTSPAVPSAAPSLSAAAWLLPVAIVGVALLLVRRREG